MDGHATVMPHAGTRWQRHGGEKALLVQHERAVARFGGGWHDCSGRPGVSGPTNTNGVTREWSSFESGFRSHAICHQTCIGHPRVIMCHDS